MPYPCYSRYMTETEKNFLEKLRDLFEDSPFGPAEAMDEFRLNELPGPVRAVLVMNGPGIGATKAMARWLKLAGCTRLSTRTRTGYLWVVPS